jgi:drug/metabolite transporter (DMT)-like permease
LIIFPLFLQQGGVRELMQVDRRSILILTAVGVVLAVHFVSWISSLRYTTVVSSVVFGHIDPILVVVISHFFLKERITRRRILGVIIAFIGAIIIAIGDFNIGGTNIYGDILAFMGAVMLGIYVISGRSIRQRLNLFSYVMPVYAVSALTLTASCFLTGTPLIPYPLREYILFIAIAVVPMIFGHTVYNWTLKYVETPIASISFLGEPLGATILAFFILNETPTLPALLGGILTLVGICITAS